MQVKIDLYLIGHVSEMQVRISGEATEIQPASASLPVLVHFVFIVFYPRKYWYRPFHNSYLFFLKFMQHLCIMLWTFLPKLTIGPSSYSTKGTWMKLT